MSEYLQATRASAGRSHIGIRGWSLLLTALLLTACPVDDRLLTANQGGAGQPSNESGTGSGAGTSATAPANGGVNDGGTAGQAGESAAGEGGALSYPDGCADLDRDHVSDCSETLLENATFTTDTQKWTAEPDASLSWDAGDLHGLPSSGSALVTSSISVMTPGDSLVAAEQCIAVRVGAILGVFANARIDLGQASGRAAVSLWFFTDDDCPGNAFFEPYETTEQFEPGKLLTLQGSTRVPNQMRSARVRLGVIKPNSAATFAVHFDNILVREE